MTISLSCPSCNHQFELNALPVDRRAVCPRCDDRFPVRGLIADTPEQPNTPPNAMPQAAPANPRSPSYVLTGLVVVVILGFVLGFTLQRKRRQPEPVPVPQAQDVPPAINAVPHMQLTAMRYLRADCNLAFAVQVGPLLHYAACLNADPREVLAQAGLPDSVRGVVDQLGVPLAQIDHFMCGMELGEGENTLRLSLVVVLKQPLADEADFLKRLKAKPATSKRPRFDVVVGKYPLLLSPASKTVWVFGLDDNDFAAVDGKPAFATIAASPLRKMIDTLPADAAIGLALNSEKDWSQQPLVKAFAQSPEAKKFLSLAKHGRGLSLGVVLGDEPRLRLVVQTANNETGTRVGEYFRVRASEIVGATSSHSDNTARFEAPFAPATSGKQLQRFVTDANAP